jgi:hypothetical protein
MNATIRMASRGAASSPKTSWTPRTRLRRGSSSIGCGIMFSGAASLGRRITLGGWARNQPIPGCSITDGFGLVLDGERAFAETEPIAKTIREKTLESWVQLSNLDQRGGGVITIQDGEGIVFDSIVYAERDKQQWMAGSNDFARTE